MILIILFLGMTIFTGCNSKKEQESISSVNSICSDLMFKLDSKVNDEIIGGYLIEKDSNVGGPTSSTKWIMLTFKGFNKSISIRPIIESNEIIMKYSEDFFIIGNFYSFDLSQERISGNLAGSYLGPIEVINCSN